MTKESFFEDTNGLSEAANRWTHNANAKIKRTRGQTMTYKTIHRKLKIEKHEPLKTNRSKDEPNISWEILEIHLFLHLQRSIYICNISL